MVGTPQDELSSRTTEDVGLVHPSFSDAFVGCPGRTRGPGCAKAGGKTSRGASGEVARSDGALVGVGDHPRARIENARSARSRSAPAIRVRPIATFLEPLRG